MIEYRSLKSTKACFLVPLRRKRSSGVVVVISCQGWGRGFESLRPLQKPQFSAVYLTPCFLKIQNPVYTDHIRICDLEERFWKNWVLKNQIGRASCRERVCQYV